MWATCDLVELSKAVQAFRSASKDVERETTPSCTLKL